MVNRKNSFQLYGADFLIMDDLSVWLIEINTNPRLHPPSSTVTEELYPEIIEDTIKGNYWICIIQFLPCAHRIKRNTIMSILSGYRSS